MSLSKVIGCHHRYSVAISMYNIYIYIYHIYIYMSLYECIINNLQIYMCGKPQKCNWKMLMSASRQDVEFTRTANCQFLILRWLKLWFVYVQMGSPNTMIWAERPKSSNVDIDSSHRFLQHITDRTDHGTHSFIQWNPTRISGYLILSGCVISKTSGPTHYIQILTKALRDDDR